MVRRRKIPSSFRWMRPLVWGVPPVVVLILERFVLGVVCKRSSDPTCTELPLLFYVVCFGWIVACVAFSAYRWYRDKIKGEYYIDAGMV